MAETIRDVVIRMRIKQIGNKLNPPELGPAKKSVDDLNKSINILNKSETTLNTTNVNVTNTFISISKAVKEADGKTKELTGTNAELFDSFGQVGEGMLKVSRGMTLLGISADDDLRRVTEQLAKAQAALDIFTGGVQAIKAMVTAQEALATATSVTAAAQVTLTAAAVPYIAAAVILSAAVAGLVALSIDWGDAVEETGDTIEEANAKAIRSLERRLTLEKELLRIKEQQGTAVDVLGTPEEKLAKAGERRGIAAADLNEARRDLKQAKLRRFQDTLGQTRTLTDEAAKPLLTSIAEATEKLRVATESQILLGRSVSGKQLKRQTGLSARASTLEAARDAELAAFAALGEEGRTGDSRAQFKARKLPGFGQAAAALRQLEEDELGGASAGEFIAAVNRAVDAAERRRIQNIEILDRLLDVDAKADANLAKVLERLDE